MERHESRMSVCVCVKPALSLLTLTMFPSWHCVCVVLTCISPVLSLCRPNPNSPSTPPSLTLSNHTLSLTLCKSTLGHS